MDHHAFCIVGSRQAHTDLLEKLKVGRSVPIQGDPDFFDREYEAFTIDDARELKSAALMRPVGDAGKKIFIVTMNGITVEAQNALLKLLEEPPEYAHFYLIIPSAHLLLPTVRSRISFLDSKGAGLRGSISERNDEMSKVTNIFVTWPVSKRLEWVKSLVDEIAKEKRTKQDAIDFLDALQAEIRGDGGSIGGLKKNVETLKAIETARKYLNDRAPSVKMLLEYVALNI